MRNHGEHLASVCSEIKLIFGQFTMPMAVSLVPMKTKLVHHQTVKLILEEKTEEKTKSNSQAFVSRRPNSSYSHILDSAISAQMRQYLCS